MDCKIIYTLPSCLALIIQVTYGLASLMLAEGMLEEGMKTAEGVYR